MKTMLRRCYFITTMLLFSIGSFAQLTPELIPFRHGQKYGYADSTMQIKIPAIYDKAWLFYKGTACVQQGFKRGLIDSHGKMLTPFLYDDIGSNGNIESEYLLTKLNDQYGYLDLKGNILMPAVYDDIEKVEGISFLIIITKGKQKGLYRLGAGEVQAPGYDDIIPLKTGVLLLKEGGLSGLADSMGKVITTVTLDQIYNFDYGPVTWYRIGERYGFINNKGEQITQALYESAWSFADGCAVMKRDGKFGYVDKTGKEITPFIYDYCSDFGDGVGVAGKDNKYALMNAKGKLVTGFEFDGAWPSTEGMIKVLKDKKWGYINPRGRLVIPFGYDETGQFREGYAPAAVNGQWGFIDKTGKWVVEPRYQKTYEFIEGKAKVIRNNLLFLLDKSLKEITVRGYDSVGVFSKGYAKCYLGGLTGILRDDGREIVPPFYTSIKPNPYNPDKNFIVSAGKQKGMYYRDHGMILDTIYDNIENPSKNGLIMVKLNGKYGFADTTGRMVIPCRYDDASWFFGPVSEVKSGGKAGLINEKGELLIPLEYDNLLSMEGIAVVRKGMKYGVVTHNNKLVAPFIFNDWYFVTESELVRLYDGMGTVYFDSHGTRYEIPFEAPKETRKSDKAVMNQTALHLLHSVETNTDYQIFVSLPFNYYLTNKSYPVIYLTDADQLQGTFSEASRMMAFDGTIPEVIVVGIAYGGTFQDWYSKRVPDLTPTNDTAAFLFPGGGRCDAFYRFINNELIPVIEKEYRVMEGERTLTGYSLGGLFGAWVMFNQPGTFNRYMLISPSLWWDGQLALKWEEAWHQKSSDLGATLFMSLSSSEWGTPESLDKIIRNRKYNGLNYEYKTIPDENHYSTFPAAAVKGLKFIYQAEKSDSKY
jgi:predicted alpha/beta superfamily hydrolase